MPEAGYDKLICLGGVCGSVLFPCNSYMLPQFVGKSESVEYKGAYCNFILLLRQATAGGRAVVALGHALICKADLC